MNIATHHCPDLHRVIILGRLESTEDRVALLALLAPRDGPNEAAPWRLEFYDAEILPNCIVAALALALDRGMKLNLVVYRALLARSLMRLGLPVRLESGRVGTASGQALNTAAAVSTDAAPSDKLLEDFIAELRSQCGYDLRGYEPRSLKRRLRSLMIQFNHRDFFSFQRSIFTEPGQLERLQTEISVGITGFFRHPEQFLALRDDILPGLASLPLIKVWSAGCSTGEEPYSLAALLAETGLLERSQIVATDINAHFLDLAVSGLYPLDKLAENELNYRLGGGCRDLAGHLASQGRYLMVADSLRDRIRFQQHSLTRDGDLDEFHLIVCRNVLIYFDAATQVRVLAQFARSLHRDGYLLLGPEDGLATRAIAQGFVPHPKCRHLYRRQEVQAHD